MMEEKHLRNFDESISTADTEEKTDNIDLLIQPVDGESNPPPLKHHRASIFYIVDNPKPKTTFDRIRRFSGIFYAILSSFLFTCSSFLLKQFDVVLFDVLILRYIIQGILLIGFIIYKGYRPWVNENRSLLVGRSLFAASGIIAYYFGLTLLPIPDLTTIRYTQVIWTALLAVIIFHERIHLTTICACILTLTGVVCVTQPTFLFPRMNLTNTTFTDASITDSNRQRIVGIISAIYCAISISIGIVLNKKLTQRKVRQSIIMLYFVIITVILTSMLQIHYWFFSSTRPTTLTFYNAIYTKDFLYALAIAILQIFPMILSQKSIRREHPSIVTVVRSSDIIFALIIQNLFTAIKSNLLVLLGSSLVLTSIFIVGIQKLWMDRKTRTCSVSQ